MKNMIENSQVIILENKIRKRRVGNNKPLRVSPYPSKDLTGKKINKLLVVRFEEYRANKKGVRKCYYFCQCDCGKNIIVSHNELTHGRVSCGCALEYFRKAILPGRAREKFSLLPEEASFNSLYSSYKDRSKRKKIEFELTKEEFRKIATDNCYFCGVKPYQIFAKGKKHKNGHFLHNGLDRIDNQKGYTVENVKPSCEICNKAKRDLSLESFLKWVDRITEYRFNILMERNKNIT